MSAPTRVVTTPERRPHRPAPSVDQLWLHAVHDGVSGHWDMERVRQRYRDLLDEHNLRRRPARVYTDARPGVVSIYLGAT
jgi:hypothetical protein